MGNKKMHWPYFLCGGMAIGMTAIILFPIVDCASMAFRKKPETGLPSTDDFMSKLEKINYGQHEFEISMLSNPSLDFLKKCWGYW